VSWRKQLEMKPREVVFYSCGTANRNSIAYW
jgi:hypothetical protein